MLYTSLADLANSNTDDIAILRSRLTRKGIYIVTMTEAGMSEIEQTNPDDKPRAALTYAGVIEMYMPLEQDDSDGFDAASMIGKNFRQRETMWLEDVREAVGLIKGRHVAAHFPVVGVMGGAEGTEGWIDAVVGKRVAIRVRHSKGEDTRVYHDWLGRDALAKLGVEWSDMGREALDKDGNPLPEKN